MTATAGSTRRSLPGFDDRSRPDRYCDLVLTGGVTSAIAYPGVIHGLAQVYRLQSIGGASSGAGSAALAAAAEYRRRHGSTQGFETLMQRVAAIQDDIRGETGLRWLFQPMLVHRRLFAFLLPVFAGPDKRKRKFAGHLVWAYWESAALGLATLPAALTAHDLYFFQSATIGWTGWALLILCALILAAIAIGYAVWDDLRHLADDDFGMCSGLDIGPDLPHPALTPWLHALIQDTAGLPADRPMTFADLANAPGSPHETLGDRSEAGRCAIGLVMYAAIPSLSEPLVLPRGADEPPLYFRPAEFRRLFPPAVVDHMVRHSKPADDVPTLEPRRLRPQAATSDDDQRLRELPCDDLPVVVAARMSISFPLLFCGVPLWQKRPDAPGMRRLLVVDGGLCSSFPIHLFDSPVPAWPTFGIALQGGGEAVDERQFCGMHNRVSVPRHHKQLPPDRWDDFDQRARPAGRVFGYLGALLTTVLNWNDALVGDLPGVRDRVATIELPANIGGLNVRMNARQIEWLACAGGEAARHLLERYAAPATGAAESPGWREHRWVRFNVLADCLRRSLVGVSRSANAAPLSTPLRTLVREAVDHPILAGQDERALRADEALALERLLDALMVFEQALMAVPDHAEPAYRPVPRPELRIRPRN